VSAKRLIRVFGTLLAVLGVLAIAWGFVIWQWGDPVTSLYTRWKQRELSSSYDRIAERFAIPRAATTSPKQQQPAQKAAVVRAAAKRFRGSAEEGQAIGRIEVPRLGLDMVIVNGTSSGTLKTGPGRDPRTFMPGEGELVYVAGHRTTYGAPFAHIDRLERGDRVVLHMPYATAVYKVTSHVIVPADDLSRLESQGREVVALQACHPRFSASQRYIVYAKPVSINPVSVSRSSRNSSAYAPTP
jgi:sortase A